MSENSLPCTENLWSELQEDAHDSSSDNEELLGDTPFASQDEDELADLEDKILKEWEAAEDKAAADPYKILGVSRGDKRESIDAALAKKLTAFGSNERGVAKFLKIRLKRACHLLQSSRRLQRHDHLVYREELKNQGKWAQLRFKNGYYEGGVREKTVKDIEEPVCHSHFRHGKGLTSIAGVEKYEGFYQDDKRHGIGVQFWKNGDVYVGSWTEDLMHGNGIYYYSTGAMYAGPFVDGLRHGYARFSWRNGGYYVGGFINDVRQGRGFWKQPGRKETVRYVGHWQGNLKHGHGHYESNVQGYYKGQFVNDEFHGSGHLEFVDGDSYEGEFANGRPQGHGSFHWVDSGNRYTGSFWRAQKDGEGELIFQKCGHVYTGQWKEDKATGKALLQLANGDEYDGEFKHGKMNGTGSYHWLHESHYVGTFKNDLRHGEGKLDFPDGEVFKGQFFEDVRHGRGTVSKATGNEEPHEENWHFGTLVEHNAGHVMASKPPVDDVKVWGDFLSNLGHVAAQDSDEETLFPASRSSPRKITT